MAANVAKVREAVTGLDVGQPAYSLGINVAEEPTDVEVEVVCIGLEQDRARMVGELSPYRAFREVWRIADYGEQLDVLEPMERSQQFDQAVELLLAHIEAWELGDLSRVVFNLVAAELTRVPPIVPHTDDFLAFAYDEGRNDDLLENLRAAATPAVAAALRVKRLLPDSWRELEGAPASPRRQPD